MAYGSGSETEDGAERQQGSEMNGDGAAEHPSPHARGNSHWEQSRGRGRGRQGQRGRHTQQGISHAILCQ